MTQTINVDFTPGSFQPVLNLSQGDVGREFVINILGFDIPSTATIKIEATKPSGFGFSVSGSAIDNSVTFATTVGMTDESGRFFAKLKITNGDVLLGTARFLINCDPETHSEGTIDGQAEQVVPQLTLLVQAIQSSNARIESLTAIATTLAAGSDATAVYDASTNTLYLGIPKGKDGFLTDNTIYFTDPNTDGNIVITTLE